MYDNNIKLLELNALKHKIESLDIITEFNQIIAIIKMTFPKSYGIPYIN